MPQPSRAIAEIHRVAREGGTVAVYVWDYAGQMQLMRYFWDAAVALDPAASLLDEGQRFPICQPEPLLQLFRADGLRSVEVRMIDVPTAFRDFEDYWLPFLGGQGLSVAYVPICRRTRQMSSMGGGRGSSGRQPFQEEKGTKRVG